MCGVEITFLILQRNCVKLPCFHLLWQNTWGKQLRRDGFKGLQCEEIWFFVARKACGRRLRQLVQLHPRLGSRERWTLGSAWLVPCVQSGNPACYPVGPWSVIRCCSLSGCSSPPSETALESPSQLYLEMCVWLIPSWQWGRLSQLGEAPAVWFCSN